MFRKQVKKIIEKASSNDYLTLNLVTLSRSNLINNVQVIQNQHSGFTVIPVLKANAYGHGLREIADILNDSDCSHLAVDGYFEASRIRDITKHRILVLGYIRPENVKLLDLKKCSFVVQDIAGLKSFNSLGKPVRVHIELNTGMNRLGLQPDELDSYLNALKKLKNITLEGVMTHLADADNPTSDSYTKQQTELFDHLVSRIARAGFKPKLIHIAQTAGSTKVSSKYANAIRLGIGLYGISPLHPPDKNAEDLSKLKPVLELKSTIIKVLDLKKGDRVSYNGIFKAPKSMKIAILPLGYYEGIPRQLSNKGIVTYEDQELPIIGRVCMNHTMIDIGSSDLRVGDEVTVISRIPSDPNSINNICSKNGLFNYSLMTGISSDTRRSVI
jgi:alanine racemase